MFTLAHVGVNAASEQESLAIARLFAALFDVPVKEGNSSNFADNLVEVMKTPYRGKNGHIAIGTPDVAAAEQVLLARGFACDQTTAKEKNGERVAIYLQDEIGGFAVHLLKI